jgi:hypothetical protein
MSSYLAAPTEPETFIGLKRLHEPARRYPATKQITHASPANAHRGVACLDPDHPPNDVVQLCPPRLPSDLPHRVAVVGAAIQATHPPDRPRLQLGRCHRFGTSGRGRPRQSPRPPRQFYTDATRHSDLDLPLASFFPTAGGIHHVYAPIMPDQAVLVDSWTWFCPECAQKVRRVSRRYRSSYPEAKRVEPDIGIAPFADGREDELALGCAKTHRGPHGSLNRRPEELACLSTY